MVHKYISVLLVTVSFVSVIFLLYFRKTTGFPIFFWTSPPPFSFLDLCDCYNIIWLDMILHIMFKKEIWFLWDHKHVYWKNQPGHWADMLRLVVICLFQPWWRQNELTVNTKKKLTNNNGLNNMSWLQDLWLCILISILNISFWYQD